MSFFAHWQPLVDEDAHTALTFGFLRHAPVEHVLQPWLAKVLERDRTVTVARLGRDDFWRSYESILHDSKTTVPELVFEANDGEPLVVVVEAKRGFGQQRLNQITREVVDVANVTNDARRVVCVMVGADLGPPMPISEWEAHVRDQLVVHSLPHVSCELRYASWASLGKIAESCTTALPEWALYAQDVAEQLRLNARMGYSGAPSLEGLEGGLTLGNAVRAFNLMIEEARQFFVALHGDSRFVATGIGPAGDRFRILRDGSSTESPTSASEFATTLILSLYRNVAWPKQHLAFVSFDLAGSDDPQLVVGAVHSASGTPKISEWAWAGRPRDVLNIPALRDRPDTGLLPWSSTYEETSQWVYDATPWLPHRPAEDIVWALDKLEASCKVWDASAGS